MSKSADAVRRIFHSCEDYLDHLTEVVIAAVSVAVGITQLFPGNGLPESSFIHLSSQTVTTILSVLEVIAGSLLFIGIWSLGLPWSKVVRRLGSFTAFLCFSYTAILGISSDDISTPFAIMAGGIAIISGIIHIREKRRTNV